MPGHTLSVRYIRPQPVANVRLQPYITKTYFGMENPPVNLTRIAIGDGAIGSFTEFEQLPMVIS